jgi:hypothetical protein
MRGMVLGLVVVVAGCMSTRPPPPTSVTPGVASVGGGSKPTATVGATGGGGTHAVATAGTSGAALTTAGANTGLGDAAGRPVNRALVAQGYRPTTYRGQLFYCRKQKLTGSQFTQKVCLTEQEAALQERIAQDQMRQRNWGVKCLPPLCPPTK